MLATQDIFINEATFKLHKLIENQKFRDQLWAREDYIRRENIRNEQIKQHDEQINTLKKSNTEKDTTIAEQSATISDMAAEIAALKARLNENNQ